MNNYSCSECHEKIYDEFQTSAHSKSYFTNELHRKIANKADPEKYECATCHMPMANNLKDLVTGKAKPNKHNKTHSDGVSCYFCHTIAYVKKSHKHNINIKARQAKGYKPTLYGILKNPEASDKHSSVNNPVYTQKACMGCHSHKLNENNITIFRAMNDKQNSKDCIKCHMPELAGGADKLNKKTRPTHASHKFLGIRDVEFRKTGLDINIETKDKKLTLSLNNKMSHPLIIQAARVKFLKIQITRDSKTIWQNYQKNPNEDKQGYFTTFFKKNGKDIIIPATATKRIINNIEAKESKNLTYKIPPLQKGDNITVALYVQLGKTECTQIIELENMDIIKPMLMKKVSKIIGGKKSTPTSSANGDSVPSPMLNQTPIYHYQIKN